MEAFRKASERAKGMRVNVFNRHGHSSADVDWTETRWAFLRAAKKDDGSSGISFLEAILRERKDLRRKIRRGELTVVFPERGSANVVIIGDEVFKGPKSEWNIWQVDLECRLLQHMKGLGLPFPEVTCVGKKSVFFGMKKIPGAVFGGRVNDMNPAELRDLAREMAGAVIGMAKAFTDEQATEVFDIPQKLPRLEEFQEVIHDLDVRAALGAALPDCERLMREYIDAFSTKKPVVMNTDMNPGNAFMDEQTKKLTGLIDLGYVKFCIPECDPVGVLLHRYPDAFVQAFCEESTAQGVPINYRHAVLNQLAGELEFFQDAVQRHDLGGMLRRLPNVKEVIEKLNKMDVAAGPEDRPDVSPVRRQPPQQKMGH